jgi:hypothetical protein
MFTSHAFAKAQAANPTGQSQLTNAAICAHLKARPASGV